MQVSIEKVSNFQRKLTIVVPPDQMTVAYNKAYNKQINQLAQNANIKGGFRPGTAPMRRMVEQRFGDSARQEALSQVIQETLQQAIQTHQLQPISTPQVEPKQLLLDQPFEFIASFEVLPELSAIQFKIEGVKKPAACVKDEDIDRVLESLRKQHTKWHAVSRGAVIHDRVVMNYRMSVEGETEEATSENVPLELGSQSMLPGFEEGLVGVQPGESRVLHLSFPKDWRDEKKAGKAIECHVDVRSVYEPEIPHLDQHFAKQLGIQSGSLDELKQQIKQSLEQECHRLVQEKLKEQIFSQLLEQNPFDVPPSLITREAARIHHDVYPKHAGSCEHQEHELATFHDIAKKRVALSLLISAYAKEAALIPDKVRVEQRIAEVASAYENPEAVREWLLSRSEYRSNIEAQVLEEMVLERLMAGAVIQEVVMGYSELKGIHV